MKQPFATVAGKAVRFAFGESPRDAGLLNRKIGNCQPAWASSRVSGPLVLFACLAFLLIGTRFAAAVDVALEIDRATLFEGEQILYRITLNAEEPIDAAVVPDIAAWKDFRAEYHGRQDSSGQFTSFINGRQSQRSQYAARYTYELFPLKTGRVAVPFPNLMLGGQTLKPGRVLIGGRPIDLSRLEPDGSLLLQVEPPTQQDIVQMEITTDRREVYPLQPFEVTLTVRLKELTGSYGRDDPLTLLTQPPRLQIPWVETGMLPGGVKPKSDRESWLGGLETRQGGFAINDLSRRDLMGASFSFGNFDPLRPVVRRFAFSSTTVRRPNADGTETDYRECTLRRTFTAERLGALTFGPVSFKGTVAVQGSDADGTPVSRSIYTVASPVTVTVRDVPAAGRPAGYLGAFGSFDWQVELQPRSAHLGEPLTLTLTLAGEGSTLDVRPPDLEAVPEIAAQFRVFTPTERSDPGRCTFTYSIRPTVAGTITFPPIEAAWFDVASEKFVTRQSEPITLEIKPAGTLTAAETGSVPGGDAVTAGSSRGVFANTLETRGAVNAALPFPLMAGAALAPLACYAFLVAGLFFYRRRVTDPQRNRRRHAAARAAQRLAVIAKTQPNASESIVVIRGAVIGLIADLTGGEEQGMTTGDACRRLQENAVSPDCIDRTRALLESLDAARYGSQAIQADLLHEAEEVRRLLAVQAFIAAPRNTGLPAVSVLLALFFLPIIAGCGSVSPEHQRLFEQARETFADAMELADSEEQREMFEKAALLYRQLIDDGVRNGTVYGNQAEAWALAGQPIRALAAYRAAEQFGPIPQPQRVALETALGSEYSLSPPRQTPLWEMIFFWQNRIGYGTKMKLMVPLAWLAGGLAALALFPVHGRKWIRRAALLLTVAAVVVFASTAYDYWRYDLTRHAMILSPAALPLKGNSRHYEPSFTQPPPPGTEAVVQEQRGMWRRLRFPDGREGWLPAEELVIY